MTIRTPYKSEEFVEGAEENAVEIAKALAELEFEIERIDDDALVTATYPDGFQVVIDRCEDNEIEIRLW